MSFLVICFNYCWSNVLYVFSFYIFVYFLATLLSCVLSIQYKMFVEFCCLMINVKIFFTFIITFIFMLLLVCCTWLRYLYVCKSANFFLILVFFLLLLLFASYSVWRQHLFLRLYCLTIYESFFFLARRFFILSLQFLLIFTCVILSILPNVCLLLLL